VHVLPALILLAILIVGWKLHSMRPDVKGAEARRLVEGGARLLDVRTPAEFAATHLPGALNVSVDALERRIAEIGPKDRPVVVYCASGVRSAHAKQVLARHGFTTVRNLGPMHAW
jgi:phage shock protein E